MAQKTKVFCLPLLFANEAKYEDCQDIMDSYISELRQLYTSAYGNA
jgi:hypothetical protein